MEAMGLGKTIIEKLRELGSLADNLDQARKTADACERIETIMLSLNERRMRILDRWERRLQESYSRATHVLKKVNFSINFKVLHYSHISKV